MGYINIFVSKDAHINIKDKWVVLKNTQKSSEYPLEDINSVMIENLASTISTYTLSKFAEHNILVFICNNSHLPSGILLPFSSYYRPLSIYKSQVGVSKPLQKQLWQQIIKNKISNQNEVLNRLGGSDELKKYFDSVLSGDSKNSEAVASQVYFKKLFGKNFTRDNDEIINALLNYGYSIIRGFVARSITVHGFVPFLGLFHKNEFNAFNLADDLMEVFRPLVDLFVKTNLSQINKFSSVEKGLIYNIINIDVEIDRQKHSISNAIDMFVESLAKSLKDKKVELKEIKIIGLDSHRYE